jgi:hypothetical protein
MKNPTQLQIVLSHLRRAGARGATLNDLRQPDMSIATPHARIGELIKMGFHIVKSDRPIERGDSKTHERVYRLKRPTRTNS